MSNAVLTVAYSDVPGFPAGSAVASILVSVTDTSVTPPTAVTQTVSPGTTAVTFANLAAGTYSVSVAAQDASNAVLGTPVTGTFDVPVPATVTLTLPASVSAVVS